MQFFSVLNADGELARERDPNMTGDPNSAARCKTGRKPLGTTLPTCQEAGVSKKETNDFSNKTIHFLGSIY